MGSSNAAPLPSPMATGIGFQQMCLPRSTTSRQQDIIWKTGMLEDRHGHGRQHHTIVGGHLGHSHGTNHRSKSVDLQSWQRLGTRRGPARYPQMFHCTLDHRSAESASSKGYQRGACFFQDLLSDNSTPDGNAGTYGGFQKRRFPNNHGFSY